MLAHLSDQRLRSLVLPDAPVLPELRKRARAVTGDMMRPEGLSVALRRAGCFPGQVFLIRTRALRHSPSEYRILYRESVR